jgi:hypothetical protein
VGHRRREAFFSRYGQGNQQQQQQHRRRNLFIENNVNWFPPIWLSTPFHFRKFLKNSVDSREAHHKRTGNCVNIVTDD